MIQNSKGVTFSGNHITDVTAKAGLVIRNSNRVNINNSTILDSAPVGILLDGVSESRVSDCLIAGDTVAEKVKLVNSPGTFVSEELQNSK